MAFLEALRSSVHPSCDFGLISPHTAMLECFHVWARQNWSLLWIGEKRVGFSCYVYFGLPPLTPPRYVALLPLGLEHHTLHHSTKLNAMRYVNSTLWLKNYISWTSHVLKSLIDHTLLLPFSLEQAYWKWWFFSAVITQWPCWLVLRLKSRLHFL